MGRAGLHDGRDARSARGIESGDTQDNWLGRLHTPPTYSLGPQLVSRQLLLRFLQSRGAITGTPQFTLVVRHSTRQNKHKYWL